MSIISKTTASPSPFFLKVQTQETKKSKPKKFRPKDLKPIPPCNNMIELAKIKDKKNKTKRF